MSFQRRVALSTAAAVAIAVAIASAATYVLVRNELHRHINRSLTAASQAFVAAERAMPATPTVRTRSLGPAPYPYGVLLRRFRDRPGDVTNVVALIAADGTSYPAYHGQLLRLPSETLASVRAIAHAGGGSESFDANTGGGQFRVLAVGVGPGYALVVSHS